MILESILAGAFGVAIFTFGHLTGIRYERRRRGLTPRSLPASTAAQLREARLANRADLSRVTRINGRRETPTARKHFDNDGETL